MAVGSIAVKTPLYLPSRFHPRQNPKPLFAVKSKLAETIPALVEVEKNIKNVVVSPLSGAATGQKFVEPPKLFAR